MYLFYMLLLSCTVDAKIDVAQIKSLGISTQRATFITWKKDTGEYLHNFITWKDLRALKLIKQVNSSWLVNVSEKFYSVQ